MSKKMDKKIPPVHPGEILMEEFLKPMALSQNRLANDLGVPPRRINEIVLGKRRLTADTALRMARYFDMSPRFWLGLQMDYDLDIEEDRLTDSLREVKTYAKEAR
ncbi:MAG: HigA family addiction module antidote protein [Candidatus Marinimicrobia bacterium]|nr:HigA family addiction module antidote protein [Candidatus Neomarinimicrobiota bacterium]